MKLSFFLVALSCCSAFAACQSGAAQKEDNAFKEYVNEPKRRANDVKDVLEHAQNKEQEQARRLLGDDE
jgi:hypothetical protein